MSLESPKQTLLGHVRLNLLSLELVLLRILYLSVMETVTTIRNVKAPWFASKGSYSLITLLFLPFYILLMALFDCVVCLSFIFTDLPRKQCLAAQEKHRLALTSVLNVQQRILCG
jgi:hypothetical protein